MVKSVPAACPYNLLFFLSSPFIIVLMLTRVSEDWMWQVHFAIIYKDLYFI